MSVMNLFKSFDAADLNMPSIHHKAFAILKAAITYRKRVILLKPEIWDIYTDSTILNQDKTVEREVIFEPYFIGTPHDGRYTENVIGVVGSWKGTVDPKYYNAVFPRFYYPLEKAGIEFLPIDSPVFNNIKISNDNIEHAGEEKIVSKASSLLKEYWFASL